VSLRKRGGPPRLFPHGAWQRKEISFSPPGLVSPLLLRFFFFFLSKPRDNRARQLKTEDKETMRTNNKIRSHPKIRHKSIRAWRRKRDVSRKLTKYSTPVIASRIYRCATSGVSPRLRERASGIYQSFKFQRLSALAILKSLDNFQLIKWISQFTLWPK